MTFKDNDPYTNQMIFGTPWLVTNTTTSLSENFDSSTAANVPAPATITGAYLKKENKNKLRHWP